MIRIVLPAALPEILAGCRTGLVLALITMVTSEMIARQSGAGNILFNALDMAQYDTVFAMIIIIGAMGIGLDAAFEQLRRAAGALVRAALRHAAEFDGLLMNRARSHRDIAARHGADRAGDRAVAGARVVRLCAGRRCCRRRAHVFARLLQQLAIRQFQQENAATLFRLFAGFSIAVVLGVTLGLAAAGSPAVNAVVTPDRAGAGAAAQGRALSGDAADARLRP